jgi:hypothetical protein
MKKTVKGQNNPNSPKQLSFLDDLMPGETVSIPLPEMGVGGELLNILSKGLYTNPIDAIREYVQNAIDANSAEVQIQITGNSVWILDYGDGMDREQILQAREFGVSRKSIEENVGFRGIGIYSGFDLCERLVIRSKAKFEKMEHILEFHFGEMRRKLEAARLDPERPVISLSDLLSSHTYYRYEKSGKESISFTLVQLEELSDSHINRLSTVKEMQNYILNNLPIRFSNDFIYAEQIESELRKNVPGYKSARIVLKIENNPTVVVEKPNIPDVFEPRIGFILDSKKNKLAYYWACLTNKGEAISSRRDASQTFAGLVFKQKGFTIGDRIHLQVHFTRKQLYTWWTGEIYVITPQVVPTSARDDFEAGPAKDSLEAALKDLLGGSNGSLQKIALEFQARRRADEVLLQRESVVNQAEQEILSGRFDSHKLYTSIFETIEVVKQHKGKATDKAKANALYKRAEALLKRAKREIDQPTPTAEKQKKAIQAALDIDNASADNGATQEKNPSEEQKTPENDNQSGSEENAYQPPASLLDVIRQTGWEIHESDLRIIEQIDESISDVIGRTSDRYQLFVDNIRSRLLDLMETK